MAKPTEDATDGLFAEIGRTPPAEVETWVMAAVSSRLIDAIACDASAPLTALERDLSNAIRTLITKAAPQTRGALRGAKSDAVASEAYALGQLSFAQLLAADLVNWRIDENFEEELSNPKWRKYLDALALGEKTNTELAEITRRAEATVSRDLRELRAAGITEFRKIGVHVYNFLTPVVAQIRNSKKQAAYAAEAEDWSPRNPETQALIGMLKPRDQERFQKMPMFALKD